MLLALHRRFQLAALLASIILVPGLESDFGEAPSSAENSESEFVCSDGSGKVAAAVVNDDFCDCSDGSDEPGTAACAGMPARLFYCRNHLSLPRFIYSSRVRDGLCDCCDGSDEAPRSNAGESPCPNSCEAEGAELHAKQAQRLVSAREGLQKRKELEQEAEQRVAAWQVEKERLEQEVSEFEQLKFETSQKRDSLQASLEAPKTTADLPSDPKLDEMPREVTDSELQNKRLAVDEKLAPAAGWKSTPEISEYARWAVAQEGQEVPSTAMTSTTAISEVQLGQVATPPAASCWVGSLSAELCCSQHHGPQGLSDCWDGFFTYDLCCSSDDLQAPDLLAAASDASASLAVAPELEDDGLENRLRLEDELSKANAALTELQKKLRRAKGRRFGLETKLKHIGHGSRWYPLLEACLEQRFQMRQYKICYFGGAKEGSVSLGSFQGWDENAGPLVMHFTGGQRCVGGGPARQLRLFLACGSLEELHSMLETSRCSYEARLTHPVACGPEELEAAEQRAAREVVLMPHDEL